METLTENVSAGGLYFTLPEPLEPGAELQCTLALPRDSSTGGELFIRFRANVVRVEPARPETGRIGVGAVIQEYSFLRP